MESESDLVDWEVLSRPGAPTLGGDRFMAGAEV